MTAVVPTTPEERRAESLNDRAPNPPNDPPNDPPTADASLLSPELVARHKRLATTVFAPLIRQFLEGRRTSLEAERAILDIQRAGVEAQMVLVMADADLLGRRLHTADAPSASMSTTPNEEES